MKYVFSAVLLLLAGASSAAAAEIFGTLSDGTKPLPAGVVVKLACGTATAEAKTDEFGSYSLRTSASGECQVTVEYKGASGSLPVAVYAKPTRYDLIAKEEAGKLTLSRK
ncbi:MAG TPA: carboxypeptidase-like regulatory domain-containing protein [Thermoanaerobaculia bacterium]|jgi:hypothetical protein